MKPKMNLKNFKGNPRHVMVVLTLFVFAVVILAKMLDYTRSLEHLTYSQYLKHIENDHIQSVHFVGQSAAGIFKDGRAFEVTVGDDKNISLLRAHNVDISINNPTHQFNFWYLIFMTILIIVPLVVWYIMKQMRGSNGSGGAIFSMGKSKARLFMPSQIKVNFGSVAGAQHAKEELQDIVDFLKNPEKFMRLGAKLTRGVLLVGEPGNGKTLLAKAIAGEANCPFFSISGSDFIEVFVGVGASRVRDLFEKARRQAPSIIFIDEIDAIGRQRGSGLGGGHDEREQTLNQLLIEMDGFESSNIPVIVIAATNIPDVLDKALLRPGRFDRRIEVPYPDLESREKILLIHTKAAKLNVDVDLKKIAAETAGLSGADLENLVNQAAIIATKKNHETITMEDFEEAYKKLLTQQSANTSATVGASLGKTSSKARVFMPAQVKVKFKDVAGNKEAKEEVADVIDFLRHPLKYNKLGARLTRGVLLVGDPGNGKTLLARAVAGEANCPFFSVSGSDFVEMYVGVGAARVRELFVQARKYAPCIIFIDELDAVGGKRTASASRNDERDQTLNQLLIEMDGFETSQAPVIVIAATNRKDILDSALLRPGRFDRQVHVPYPLVDDRHEILELHAKKVKMSSEVDLRVLARATPGFSGASLAALINEAAILAVREGKEEISQKYIDEARDKAIMGKIMSSKVMSPEEVYMTAVHEAGHTLTAILQSEHEPLYKVTVIPRGFSLGSTHFLPEKDRVSSNREEMLANIVSCLGGRVAEELICNRLSTGAYSDFEAATEEAYKMVCFYGMSEKLGPVVYKRNDYACYYSEKTAYEIDEEVRSIVRNCYAKAKDLLETHKEKLLILAQELLKKELMQAEEVYALLEIPFPKKEEVAPSIAVQEVVAQEGPSVG
jgi:cell division protease FtsH